jgi:hypothetical protein
VCSSQLLTCQHLPLQSGTSHCCATKHHENLKWNTCIHHRRSCPLGWASASWPQRSQRECRCACSTWRCACRAKGLSNSEARPAATSLPSLIETALLTFAAAAPLLPQHARNATAHRLQAFCAAAAADVTACGRVLPPKVSCIPVARALTQAFRATGDEHIPAVIATLLQNAGDVGEGVDAEEAAAKPQTLRLEVPHAVSPLVLCLQVCLYSVHSSLHGCVPAVPTHVLGQPPYRATRD